MKTNDESLKNFYWQDGRLHDKVGQGYGAFSVNPAETGRVGAYIANQHEHHSKKGLQDEYRGILKKYKVEDDERYVWD